MKKVLALITALVLTLAMAVGASASVPDKPSEFAYAYDFDGSVLSSSTKTTIEQYGCGAGRRDRHSGNRRRRGFPRR